MYHVAWSASREQMLECLQHLAPRRLFVRCWSTAAEEIAENRGDVARTVDDEQDQEAVFEGTVNDDVVPDGKTPHLATEVRTGAAHFRLRRVEATLFVDAIQQPVRGIGAVLADVQPEFDPRLLGLGGK